LASSPLPRPGIWRCTLYKDLAPGNIDYDSRAKSYVLGASFMPIFDFPQERVLSWLTQSFGDGEPMLLKA
jgi:strain DSM 12804, complete genome